MSLQREAINLDAQESFRLLHWQDNLREVESILSPARRVRIPGAGDRWHYHPEMELTIIERGGGTRFVGDHVGPFDSPDVVLIGPDVPHFWKVQRRSTGYALQWRFDSGHPIWQFPEAASLMELWKQSAFGLRFTGATAESTQTLVQRMAEAAGLERLTLLLQLLLCLSQASRRECVRLSKQPFDLSAVHIHQPSIERVIRHVLRHYREPIRLEDALKLAAMSRATFARQFLKHAGRTFSAFVNQVRLDATCRELVSTDASISDAAFSNGFHSLSYFNRAFLRAKKCSPKRYREQAKRNE